MHDKTTLPVFMATTQDEERDIQEAYKAGINDFILKPFGVQKISPILDQYLVR